MKMQQTRDEITEAHTKALIRENVFSDEKIADMFDLPLKKVVQYREEVEAEGKESE